MKNENQYWNLNFIRNNGIGAEGAAILGKGVSKLLSLTSLNLNIE
jgi:hypothetical protein